MNASRWLTLIAATVINALGMLILVGASSAATAAAPAACAVRLSVELTPDVPDPGDPEFLSSLLSNHPDYRLTLKGQEDGSVIVLDLAGPGPEYQCANVIDTIRRDGRVLSVRVTRTTRRPSRSWARLRHRMRRRTCIFRAPE